MEKSFTYIVAAGVISSNLRAPSARLARKQSTGAEEARAGGILGASEPAMPANVSQTDTLTDRAVSSTKQIEEVDWVR